jgi:anhydro-N-acetylmuramic acid kinase
MRPLYAIGIMSGTSLDGIDASLIRAVPKRAGYRVELVAYRCDRFPEPFRKAAREASASDSLRGAAKVGAVWAERAARTVQSLLRSAKVAPDRVDIIGAHGQTLVHEPSPIRILGESIGFTIQASDFSRLAVRTGIPVVGNFRAADIAEGGQGAPLAPHAHALLFGELSKRVAVQNLGGIGNVTLIHNGKVSLAFDTGPANTWIDAVVRRKTRGHKSFDRDATIARRGRPDSRLLAALLAHPYFRKKPPKSAGWEQFGPRFLAKYNRSIDRLSIQDAACTVTLATAIATADAYERFVAPKGRPEIVVVCGGGARNGFLIDLLAHLLPWTRVETSDRFDLPAEQVEAVCFALLAIETLRGRTSNEPSATGAQARTVCGEIAWGGPPRIDRLRSVLLR